ncbi:MAG: FAD-dependent oxidoreductase [Ilumatobacter sp.]|uniref:NAD(P)/FAD-dependent oxidoreductase n=1 Tax=Ilumatobacter sp. TaxID=1967498 RepID=UPI00262A0F11|nr:FAD-dependent oxidoreductase [Ilumatobacter sp.]MDJ0769108.1 FAD-dependent oxidoreductase [Ilumatobacter sp.]
MTACDAVVIGAGVIGSSVAFELARGGRRVVVVDKGPGPGAGSTSASSAIIRFSYSTRDPILTAWEAAPLWANWADHLGCVDPDGMITFTQTGTLVFRTTGYDGERMRALWIELGIEHELLGPDQITERFPHLDVGKYHPPKPVDDPAFADEATERLSAFYEPTAGFVDDPMLAARNLAYAARRHGAEFLFNRAVVSVERAGDGEAVTGVTLADGTVVEAPVVVNVGGPHAGRINRLAGVTDDMNIGHRALRAEVFMAPAPPGAAIEDGAPLVADLDIGQYFRPAPGRQIWIGGTEPECDELHWVDDPDANSEHPTVEVWETSMMRMARRMPEFGVPSQPNGIASMYDASDDWVPIYDRSSLYGFFMACGTSGNQFKNAPMAGQYLREIIDATMSGHDHDRDPVQFTGPRTGQTIDLGSFSRRREQADTTHSVMG